MPCKVIVNTDAGNCARLDLDALLSELGCADGTVEHIDCRTDWNADGYDTVIVCGGDGTLRNAVEKCRDKKIIYAPCGTLNETAKTCRSIKTLGKANDRCFSYVCAAGSFTEIGYSANNRDKKTFKSLAYLPQVLKSYRHRNIKAALDIDGRVINGEYTLIMVIKSHRCFGFSFNNCYKKDERLYLLAIRSFGSDSAVNRIKMFFPFFRVFFLGVDEPCEKKNWLLTPFSRLEMKLEEPLDFCMDGEKVVMDKVIRITEQPLEKEIRVVNTPVCRRIGKSFRKNTQ